MFGFFQFMLAHDRAERFRFATAQSPLGQGLYRALGLPLVEFETDLVIIGGQPYQWLDAFAATMGTLGFPLRTLSLLKFLPKFARDPTYRLIARNRYRLFGQTATCLIPDGGVQDRCLVDGWIAARTINEWN